MSIRRRLGDLAKSLDSSSVGSFLSGDSADKFQTLQWTDVSGRPNVADSATTTSIIDSAYIQARVQTYAVGLDSATGLAILDSNYMQSKVTNDVGFFIYNYDTTAGQTIMDSANEANGNAISYSEGYVMVFKNGVLLYDSDYTATSGDTIVLTSAADSGEMVTVVKWASSGSAVSAGPSRYGDTAVLFGGYISGAYNTSIDYWDMTTAGNAADFGDLTQARGRGGAVSNGTYGVCIGGWWGDNSNVMDYVTIATPSNATDFGDDVKATYDLGAVSNGTLAVTCAGLNQTAMGYFYIATPGNAASFGTGTNHKAAAYFADNNDRGIIAAGQDGGTTVNTIEYFTIATSGSVSDFGDCTVGRTAPSGCSDDTYGVIASAYNTLGAYTTMDYITIQTTGNASDFGDCSNHSAYGSGTSNGTYGHFAGGGYLYIDQIVIATPGNTTDFGDLSVVRSYTGNTATSGN